MLVKRGELLDPLLEEDPGLVVVAKDFRPTIYKRHGEVVVRVVDRGALDDGDGTHDESLPRLHRDVVAVQGGHVRLREDTHAQAQHRTFGEGSRPPPWTHATNGTVASAARYTLWVIPSASVLLLVGWKHSDEFCHVGAGVGVWGMTTGGRGRVHNDESEGGATLTDYSVCKWWLARTLHMTSTAARS